MNVEKFFELFMLELKQAPALQSYYKFLNNNKSFEFRKAYFIQRLQYIANHIKNKEATIMDCGCGYGTTALFLAMNGFKVYGATLEFYFDEINNRKKYWNQYGDAALFTPEYINIFDNHLPVNNFDYIILQDTLHHLEPLQKVLQIFKNILKNKANLVIVEENGNNIMRRMLLFMQRGNKRIINNWDEKLQKNILMGNENIRNLTDWTNELRLNNFHIERESIEYIRYYLPFQYKKYKAEEVIKKEQEASHKKLFLREYFFYGLNFVATLNK